VFCKYCTMFFPTVSLLAMDLQAQQVKLEGQNSVH
jgi:hypothetical protein